MGGNFWNSSHWYAVVMDQQLSPQTNNFTALRSNYWLLDKHEVVLTRHDLNKNGLTENDLRLMQIFTAECTCAHNCNEVTNA
jgi:hypothetical protein